MDAFNYNHNTTAHAHPFPAQPMQHHATLYTQLTCTSNPLLLNQPLHANHQRCTNPTSKYVSDQSGQITNRIDTIYVIKKPSRVIQKGATSCCTIKYH